MQVFGSQNHKPCFRLIWHFIEVRRASLNTLEVSPFFHLLLKVKPGFFVYVMDRQTSAPFLSQPRNARLSRVPVTSAIKVEIGGLIDQLSKCVAKCCRCFARLNATQLDAAIFDSFLCNFHSWSGTQIQSARYSPAS